MRWAHRLVVGSRDAMRCSAGPIIAKLLAFVILTHPMMSWGDVRHMPHGVISLETVLVGEPGNLPDVHGRGAVPYVYRIGIYEVTAAQYVEFLNAKAKSNKLGLYEETMAHPERGCGIRQLGKEGRFIYDLSPHAANRPVLGVSFWSACRFVNWLHNGQGNGDTETGAYTLNGYHDNDGRTIQRNAGARWYLPSVDEWHKAAYFDPTKPGGPGYWSYPTRSDTRPTRAAEEASAATYNNGTYLSPVTTPVGTYQKAASPFGTFDQAGNVYEWTDSVVNGAHRALRGGSYLYGPEDMQASSPGEFTLPGSYGMRFHTGFRVAASEHAPTYAGVAAERWASPREVRAKKMISTGQDSLQGGMHGVTPEYLLANPGFTASHPFDGLTVTLPLDAQWCQEFSRELIRLDEKWSAEEGITDKGRSYVLDELVWSKKAVPYAAVQQTVRDLLRIQWGPLTDNFFWYRLSGEGRSGPLAVDLTNDGDWAAIQNNAAVMARACREAKFKGFLLDTEQYGSYAAKAADAATQPEGEGGEGEDQEDGKPKSPPSRSFPMGRDSAEVLRQRGRQWIEAVQAEYPDITIIIFFGWAPDLDRAGFLAGVKDFLNGVLEGLKKPARLVHGYENTFYYGQAANSRYFQEALPGDRARYEWARQSMRKWRCFSTDPEKYDQFVEPGMAAWVESDPWNLWGPGYPSGTRDTIWSNLPLSLAYADEYVWVWSEHTHYGHAFSHKTGTNPFLASLSNQTFNTGKEAVSKLSEDFATDPLQRGWYFDFDILDAGRKQQSDQAAAIFDTNAVAYAWSAEDRAVRVRGNWNSGPNGELTPNLQGQRRRYVHPITPVGAGDRFTASLEFSVESFGSDPSNPIVLGLFHGDQLANRSSISLRISAASHSVIHVCGEGRTWSLELTVPGGLRTKTDYRIDWSYDGRTRQLAAVLRDIVQSRDLARTEGPLPQELGAFQLDEIGAAQWDVDATATPRHQAHQYLLRQVRFERRD